MIFYVRHWPEEHLPANPSFPCAMLIKQNWNDFGFTTLFELIYYTAAEQKVNCGYVKIMDSGTQSSALPSEFSALGAGCSVGQSVEYYRELAGAGADTTHEILKPLRDIVHFPEFGVPFEESAVFKTSLMRESEPTALWNGGQPNAGLILTVKRAIKFGFRCRVPGAAADHVIDLSFGDSDFLPDRIAVLIGRNGTGKTQLLRLLADAISGAPVDSTAELGPTRPSFSRVLGVSYSAFDNFRKDVILRRGSYEYCGIYKADGALMTASAQLDAIANALGQIIKLTRYDRWVSYLRAVFAEDADRIVARVASNNAEPAPGTHLSSGELILTTIISELTAKVENQTLVLFDEPELHLHPNAVSGLIQALDELLKDFNSYALLATHSPLLLQQVPSHYVRVLDRKGDQPLVRPLNKESFGENLTAITEGIFFSRGEASRYRQVLQRLAKEHTVDEINAFFKSRLSLNALAFVSSLVDPADGNKDQQNA